MVTVGLWSRSCPMLLHGSESCTPPPPHTGLRAPSPRRRLVPPLLYVQRDATDLFLSNTQLRSHTIGKLGRLNICVSPRTWDFSEPF